MPRDGLSFPVSYPTSCSPQAWAAASPLLFLRTLLRFEPDIRANKLHLAPAVPDWIGTLRLERIPIMGGHLGVEVTGEVVKVLEVPEDLTIVSDPRRADDRPAEPVRERPGEREGEVAVGVGPPLDELHARAAASSRSTRARVNLALTSVRISSPAANGTSSSSAPHVHRLRARRAQPHLDPLAFGVEHRDVLERVDVEVGVELAVHHAQHVLVELGRDALRVVVRGLEPGDVLHEVGAEQEVVVGTEHRRDVAQERPTGPRASRLPIVPPRNTTRRRPPRGMLSRSRVKSPTTGCTSMPGVLRLDRGGGVVQRRLLTSNGTKRRSVPAVAHPVEQHAGLLRRSRAELDERVGVGAPRDLAARALRGSPARGGSGSTPASRVISSKSDDPRSS